MAELADNPTVGIIAPRLIFPSGGVQDSVKRFPSFVGKFSRIPVILFKAPIRPFDTYPDFPFTKKRAVDYAISACWFGRREVFEDAGWLDERIFYAPEDIDFCLRLWKRGLTTIYYPDYTVIHHIQRLTHKKVFSKVALSHFAGLVYYFAKHRYLDHPRRQAPPRSVSGDSSCPS